MFQSSKNSQAWKTPSDCVSCSATAKVGRQTLTTGNLNFQCQQVEKSLFAVFATQNGAKCDLFVEKMRATKVNMHQCLLVFFFCFFLCLWNRNWMFCCTDLLLILLAIIFGLFLREYPKAVPFPYGFTVRLLIFASDFLLVLDERLCEKDDIYYILLREAVAAKYDKWVTNSSASDECSILWGAFKLKGFFFLSSLLFSTMLFLRPPPTTDDTLKTTDKR